MMSARLESVQFAVIRLFPVEICCTFSLRTRVFVIIGNDFVDISVDSAYLLELIL